MKKSATALLVVLAAALLAAPFAAAEKNRRDLAIIRTAVAAAPAAEPSTPPRWFKIVVTDDRCGKDVFKLSLPIGLCELVLSKCHDPKVNLDRHLSEVDLSEIWSELKRSAPRTIIEVSSGKETVKIWFE